MVGAARKSSQLQTDLPRQEELSMKVKKVEKVKASGWIWGGGG
jgi:hypothetical protein